MESGNGKVIELLERIAGGLDGVNERLDATNERLDATNERLDATNRRLDSTNARLEATRVELRAEMREGFASVNARLDNALGFLGRAHRDHEERIRALEERVFDKPT